MSGRSAFSCERSTLLKDEATVEGVSVTKPGQTNSVRYNNVGTMASISPRVAADGRVVVELEISHSHVGASEEGVPIATSKEGTTLRAPATETATVRTSLSVLDGQTVVLGGMHRRTKSGKSLVILVTPHILPIDRKTPTKPAA